MPDKIPLDPNFTELAQAIQGMLGCQLLPPPPDVMAIIAGLSARDLLPFHNARTIEGMQELFKTKSIRATLDRDAQTMSLSRADIAEIERELQAEHGRRKVMKFSPRAVTEPILRPPEPVAAIAAAPPAPTAPAKPPEPLPPGFEHLEAFEQMCQSVVDVLLRQGQLRTGDKDVLRKIQPADLTLESRIIALERWQAELARRIRGMMVPKMQQTLTLVSAEDQQKEKIEEALARRFDSLLQWMSKLIKAFEATGYRYREKPMWLPR
jgi:hypothetical protein